MTMAEMKKAPPPKKKGPAPGLPRLGTASRLALIVGIFLVIALPLFLLYQQQPAQQAALSQQLATLQKLAAAGATRSIPVETEIAQAEKELKAIKAVYPRMESAPEITEELLALAKANGLEVTSTSITRTKRTITQGKQKIDFPVLSLKLGVRGQVPKIQNFLLGLDPKFAMSQVPEVNIDIAPTEKELDKATIVIDIICLSEGQ